MSLVAQPGNIQVLAEVRSVEQLIKAQVARRKPQRLLSSPIFILKDGELSHGGINVPYTVLGNAANAGLAMHSRSREGTDLAFDQAVYAGEDYSEPNCEEQGEPWHRTMKQPDDQRLDLEMTEIHEH